MGRKTKIDPLGSRAEDVSKIIFSSYDAANRYRKFRKLKNRNIIKLDDHNYCIVIATSEKEVIREAEQYSEYNFDKREYCKIASDLCYPMFVQTAILKAKTRTEVSNILTDARHENFEAIKRRYCDEGSRDS